MTVAAENMARFQIASAIRAASRAGVPLSARTRSNRFESSRESVATKERSKRASSPNISTHRHANISMQSARSRAASRYREPQPAPCRKTAGITR